MREKSGVGRTTRDYLRVGTAEAHDTLDVRLGALVEGDERDYARFLDIQYRARVNIQSWLSERCADTAPPRQTDVIARDLAELGVPIPSHSPAFDVSADSDPLGTCWVLAGSSLGNRAILARLVKAEMQWPVAFLSDRRVVEYWQRLRPFIERPHSPVDDPPVLAAAQASFAHFNAVASQVGAPETTI